MASKTTNYELNKIDLADSPPDITVLNTNADIIDTQLKKNADAITAANTAVSAVKTTADAALPASSFTGTQILSKMAATGSVLSVANGGTGATDLSAFFKNKGNITSSDDADNFKETGFYQVVNSSITNLPSGVNAYGLLFVINKDGYISQMFHSIVDGYLHLYKRMCVNSTWKDWVQIIDTANLIPQSMKSCTTSFNSDGSIAETYTDGVRTTTFNSDGSITEKFVETNGRTTTKKTTFNSNGTISEVIS